MNKKHFLFSVKMFFLTFLFFAVMYAIIFFLKKENLLDDYSQHIQLIPSIQNYGLQTAQKVQNITMQYGYFAGLAFGVFGLLFSSIVYVIFKISKLKKYNCSIPLALLVGWSPILFFGHNMIFVSGKMTALSSGLVYFVGYPLWYATLILTGILGFIFLFSIFKKRTIQKASALFVISGMSLLFAGCADIMNMIMGTMCEFFPDKTHCYQEEAVASGDSDECDKVPNKKEFEGSGSNPPRDKCYLMIAQNTGDPVDCEKVQGGMYSYSREECIEGAFKNGTPEACKNSKDPEKCRQMYGEKTGNCGEGYQWNADLAQCESGSDEVDPECADPTFTSQCTGSHTLLVCNEGKKSIQTCEWGCFEAWCRESEGPTDIPQEEPQKEEEDAEDPAKEEEKKKEEEKECNCGEDEVCIDGKCQPTVPVECESDRDCHETQKCSNQLCITKDAECIFSEDCGKKEQCVSNMCKPLPPCKSGDKICLSSTTLQYCADGNITEKTCEWGCKESKCLSEKEKEKEEDELKCKEGYKSCVSEVTLETCSGGFKVQQMCEFGCKSNACQETPEDEKCTGLQRFNPFCSEDDDDIEDKLETDVNTIKDAVSGKYMELLDAEIETEIDPAKLEGLKKYKEFLEQAGKTMDSVNTSIDSLKNLKRIFVDSYDPSMDVENMPVHKILSKGFFDKISDSIWGEPQTDAGKEMASAEDALTVYEKMLERQAEIDFLKKSRLDRLGNVIVDEAKGKVADEIKDKAADIAGKVAGKAMIAVSVVDHALTSFQDEAKKKMFVGLARAYNRRRAEIESQFPDASEEEVHQIATQQVKDMPYGDEKDTTFAKFGNLLENADCQDSTNPLCLDSRVWWTAMDKTYQHNNRDKLRKRQDDQFYRRLEKSKALEENS